MAKRLKEALNHHPARPFLEIRLEGEEGALVLSWHRREEAVAQAAALDGRCLVVTNDLTLDANTLLALSKRRDVAEKRFSTVKAPLAARPVYVHKQERVLGLIFCTLAALLVYALVELECKRVCIRRSATALFEEFVSLAVEVTRFPDGSALWRRSGLGPNHVAVLEALGLSLAQGYAILKC